MLSTSLYTKEGLTLEELSEKIKLNSRDISRAINENFGNNFYEYVNFLRVKKAEELIKLNAQGIRISEAMYATGFNSRSSFNYAFKKHTGLTPTQYRAQFKAK